MSSRAQQIKDILVSLAVNDKLPQDLNELDPGIFEPALAGAVFPGEMKDRYVSLEVPAGTDSIRVKLDDEGVVVDAFAGYADRARIKASLARQGQIRIGDYLANEKELYTRIIDKIPGAQFHKIIIAIKTDLEKENA